MYPYIFGVIDSYAVMIALGIIACFLVTFLYLKKKTDFNTKQILSVFIMGTFSIVVGIVFAILFENLYELIQKGSSYSWTWGMTFYGGLFGGVLTFLLLYHFMGKKDGVDIKQLLIIAPGSITLAHTFGRLGCFLDGCCYGKETTSWIGVKFPDLPNKVIPTQLIEMIFLLILSGILIYLAFAKKYKYSFIIYALSYSVFRFINEFFRGDYRGGTFLSLYPSQWWCIIIFLLTPLLWFILNKIFNKNYEEQSL